MKKHLHTALTAVCLSGTLTSCVQWGIGKRIEDSFNTYSSVDTRVPVEGKVYRLEKDGATTWYMQAPGITCRQKHYLVTPPDLFADNGKQTFISGVRYTGQNHWVQVHPAVTGVKVWDCPGNIPTTESIWIVDQYVDGLPKDAKLWHGTQPRNTQSGFPAPTPLPGMGDAASSRGSLLAGSILGAPFTYVIDPALTLVSSAPVAVFHLFGGLLAIETLQNQQPQPDSNTAEAHPGKL